MRSEQRLIDANELTEELSSLRIMLLKLSERGCVRVYHAHNVRDLTTTVTCVVLAKPLNLN